MDIVVQTPIILPERSKTKISPTGIISKSNNIYLIVNLLFKPLPCCPHTLLYSCPPKKTNDKKNAFIDLFKQDTRKKAVHPPHRRANVRACSCDKTFILSFAHYTSAHIEKGCLKRFAPSQNSFHKFLWPSTKSNLPSIESHKKNQKFFI